LSAIIGALQPERGLQQVGGRDVEDQAAGLAERDRIGDQLQAIGKLAGEGWSVRGGGWIGPHGRKDRGAAMAIIRMRFRPPSRDWIRWQRFGRCVVGGNDNCLPSMMSGADSFIS
jgi:hypothetical protein